MKNVRVWYTGQLRGALGRSHDETAFDQPPTVGELLARLSQKHGEAFQENIFDGDGCLRSGILVCVGEAHVGDDLSRRLEHNDEVTILMAIGGG